LVAPLKTQRSGLFIISSFFFLFLALHFFFFVLLAQADRTQREVRDEIEREIGRVEGDGNREREIERTEREMLSEPELELENRGRSDRPEDVWWVSWIIAGEPRRPERFLWKPKTH
jgi:predicted Zn-dependent peptidase